jgi:hypothetical protein
MSSTLQGRNSTDERLNWWRKTVIKGHTSRVSTSADGAARVLERSHVRKGLVDVFPNVVVEGADSVRWGSRNLQREIANLPYVLELEPRSRAASWRILPISS